MKLFIFMMISVASCSVEQKQTADAKVRIEMAFPECAQIEDDYLLVECIKAASKLEIQVNGDLTDGTKEILDGLGIDVPEEDTNE